MPQARRLAKALLLLWPRSAPNGVRSLDTAFSSELAHILSLQSTESKLSSLPGEQSTSVPEPKVLQTGSTLLAVSTNMPRELG